MCALWALLADARKPGFTHHDANMPHQAWSLAAQQCQLVSVRAFAFQRSSASAMSSNLELVISCGGAAKTDTVSAPERLLGRDVAVGVGHQFE